MSYERSCVGGMHVFRMAYLTICCVFFWNACLTGGHLLLKVNIAGGHVLQFEISYVLLEGMSYRKPCIT